MEELCHAVSRKMALVARLRVLACASLARMRGAYHTTGDVDNCSQTIYFPLYFRLARPNPPLTLNPYPLPLAGVPVWGGELP